MLYKQCPEPSGGPSESTPACPCGKFRASISIWLQRARDQFHSTVLRWPTSTWNQSWFKQGLLEPKKKVGLT